MPDALVIFGSGSDKAVFGSLMKKLSELKVKADLRILSAHKSPAELSVAIEKSNARIFVAGAGLSAALPGVVASKVIEPVIGLPCGGNYAGLDAFLSCSQMPSGIPVLSTGVDNADEAAFAVNAFLNGFDKVEIVQPAFSDFELFEKASDIKVLFERFGIEFYTREKSEADAKTISIHLVEAEKVEKIEPFDAWNCRIFVPMASATGKAELALKVFGLAKQGLWVGLNRTDNAALAAVQLLNGSGKFSEQLSQLRAEAKTKVLAADKKGGA